MKEHAILHILSHECLDACFLPLLCRIRGNAESLDSYRIINSKSHLKWEPCKEAVDSSTSKKEHSLKIFGLKSHSQHAKYYIT